MSGFICLVMSVLPSLVRSWCLYALMRVVSSLFRYVRSYVVKFVFLHIVISLVSLARAFVPSFVH